MCRTVRDKRTYIFVIAFLLLFSISHAESSSSKQIITFFVGSEYMRPHFSIDYNTYVSGEVVHFFTSRPIDYLGWYFKYTHQIPLSDNFGYGGILGVGFWQTGYWLNWEIPEYFISLNPLKSNVHGYYIDVGVQLYRRLGRFKILPFLVVPVGESGFSITIGDESEVGNAFYLGLAGGVETQLDLSKRLSLTFGYKTTKLLKTTRHYEVEKGIKLEGKFSKMPQEFYGGLSFRVK